MGEALLGVTAHTSSDLMLAASSWGLSTSSGVCCAFIRVSSCATRTVVAVSSWLWRKAVAPVEGGDGRHGLTNSSVDQRGLEA